MQQVVAPPQLAATLKKIEITMCGMEACLTELVNQVSALSGSGAIKKPKRKRVNVGPDGQPKPKREPNVFLRFRSEHWTNIVKAVRDEIACGKIDKESNVRKVATARISDLWKEFNSKHGVVGAPNIVPGAPGAPVAGVQSMRPVRK